MTSSRRSLLLSSLSLVAAFVAIATLVRPDPVTACGYDGEDGVEMSTTFDPSLLTEDAGLYWDPYHAGFGGQCDNCAVTAALADWTGYLGKNVAPDEWKRLLFEAKDAELQAAAKKQPKLAAAIGVVRLARDIENYSVVPEYSSKPKVKAPDALVSRAKLGAKTKDAFLAQRYAFLGLRAKFYARDPFETQAYYSAYAKQLAGPSRDLAWRARYYYAGALMSGAQRSQANLELARIHSGYDDLAAIAAQDFFPLEDKDWKATLALAKSPAEKAMLWRLVGLKLDGIVALQEIAKIDPGSPSIPLLVVRELAKIESGIYDASYEQSKKKRDTELDRLDAIVRPLLTKKPDRPWLITLVAGHLAALRGDLPTARANLTQAMTLKPNDKRVTAQAKASLAMGLAKTWKTNPANETEIAQTMAILDPDFQRLMPVTQYVRHELAIAYVAAGKHADAEFLEPGAADRDTKPGAPSKWHDPAFINSMIAREKITTTPFDKFVVANQKSIYQGGGLLKELAWRHALDGKIGEAAVLYRSPELQKFTNPLGTDPFYMRIIDCHDCDHAAYANAPWDEPKLVAKLAELEKTTKKGGDAGAKAAIAIGTVFYNLTWAGNARIVLEGTHQFTDSPTRALDWFSKAYAMAKSREVKARAAYYAAKAELAIEVSKAIAGNNNSWGYYNYMEVLPTPATWFPALAKLKDTAYYKEVINECGHFSRYVYNQRR